MSRISFPQVEQPEVIAFRSDVIRGLRQPHKELPSKYFYDAIGSGLFEQITRLDEYYVTRTELAIMQEHIEAMARQLGPLVLLIEYGSGSSTKTRLLLDHLVDPAGYVPIDVSGEHLQQCMAELAREYPQIEILPLCADFSGKLDIPKPRQTPARRVVYFPGSTIGNLTTPAAVTLLQKTALLCGPGGGFLVGADLQKDVQVLEAAYNDRLGITGAFNGNLLLRINRELQGDFAVDRFRHRAIYNPHDGRMEMYLVSTCTQKAHVGDQVFHFQAGEAIRTEYSHKYTLAGLEEIAIRGGFVIDKVWTDTRHYFAVCYLRVI